MAFTLSDDGKARVWATLVTKASYVVATLVLHHTLTKYNTQYPLVVMATPQLDDESRRIFKSRGILVRDIQPMNPLPGAHKLAEHDKRFEDTWTKLRVFELVEYDRVILVDSDMIFRQNADELMSIELPQDWIAASHACTCNPRKFPHYPQDWIPDNCAYTSMVHPDCLDSPADPNAPNAPRGWKLLNSGLVVTTPSLETMQAVSDYLRTSPLVPTFSFPDQDLLAAFFSGQWKPLPYIYNGLKPVRYVHPAMWRDDQVKVVHFISVKPWETRVLQHPLDSVTHAWWWEEYAELKEEMEVIEDSGWEYVNRYVVQE